MVWHKNPGQRIYVATIVNTAHLTNDYPRRVKVDKELASPCGDRGDEVGMIRSGPSSTTKIRLAHGCIVAQNALICDRPNG
jgi:hypothetical protein